MLRLFLSLSLLISTRLTLLTNLFLSHILSLQWEGDVVSALRDLQVISFSLILGNLKEIDWYS